MVKSGTILPRQWSQGATPPHRGFLHDEDGTRRASAQVFAAVDQMVKELERVDRPVDSKDVDIVILSGLTPQYDAEVRMLESSSDWPARGWIERAVISQFERLESEKSAAGSMAMFAGRRNGHGSNPPPRCQICSRTGHTAQGCKEFRDLKKGQKTSDGNGGNNGDRCGGNSKSKHRKAKAHNHVDDEYTAEEHSHADNKYNGIRHRCYFCEGAHKSDDCPNRAEATDTAYGAGPKQGGFAGSLRGILGAGLFASVNPGSAPIANDATKRLKERHGSEFWANDSGVTEHMTRDPLGLEDCTPAPAGERVESAGGDFLPVTGYGRLRLQVDQSNSRFTGLTRELILERVAHVPNLGQQNLLSTKRLTQIYHPRRGGKSLIFRPLRPENGLLEIRARRRVKRSRRGKLKTVCTAPASFSSPGLESSPPGTGRPSPPNTPAGTHPGAEQLSLPPSPPGPACRPPEEERLLPEKLPSFVPKELDGETTDREPEGGDRKREIRAATRGQYIGNFVHYGSRTAGNPRNAFGALTEKTDDKTDAEAV